jgi:hypothetical protein
MPESLTLSSPLERALPTITGYSVWSLYLGRGEGVVRVIVEDNNGHRTTAVYEDDGASTVATDLMVALNKANLTTQSLQRRVLARLATDGKLPAGSVTGTVD